MGNHYVYLLHFREPFHHARHYVGFTTNLQRRMKKHRNGEGSKLVRAVMLNGGDFTVARVWRNGTRGLERQLKNRKNTPQLCPICNKQVYNYWVYRARKPRNPK